LDRSLQKLFKPFFYILFIVKYIHLQQQQQQQQQHRRLFSFMLDVSSSERTVSVYP